MSNLGKIFIYEKEPKHLNQYKQHFENILKDYDAVIHFSFSSEISSTGNNARMAAEEMENVYVIDSLNLCCGISILMLECADRIEKGMEIEQIIKEIKDLIPKVQSAFVIDTLRYLHKGGRCSSIALLGANLLKIKPRISVIDGKMLVTKKYRGKIEDVSLTFFDELVQETPPDTKRAFIVTSTPLAVQEVVADKFKQLGVKEVYFAPAGPSICIHCGENTFGVMYLAK